MVTMVNKHVPCASTAPDVNYTVNCQATTIAELQTCVDDTSTMPHAHTNLRVYTCTVYMLSIYGQEAKQILEALWSMSDWVAHNGVANDKAGGAWQMKPTAIVANALLCGSGSSRSCLGKNLWTISPHLGATTDDHAGYNKSSQLN
jgi:hypothetical protein